MDSKNPCRVFVPRKTLATFLQRHSKGKHMHQEILHNRSQHADNLDCYNTQELRGEIQFLLFSQFLHRR